MRRVIGRALLGTEIETLCDHLLPHQLAVGVPAGVEAMPHVTRQWRDDNAREGDKVLVNYDEGNAHNEVDRHTFLVRMREVAPGLCKWLEFIYPTDVATHIFYRGRLIASEAGGQQGCPLIGACHALVKRMVHESLGLIAPLEGSSVHLPRIDRPLNLDIAPKFADDGIIAGASGEVLRGLRHMKRVMPMVGLRFSLLQVVAAVPGPQSLERFQVFVAEGCVPALDGNFEVLKSPVGDDAFCRAFCARVATKQRAVLEFLGGLGDPQVTHYLAKWCVNGSRMNYLARTTPPQWTHDASLDFDKAVVDTIGAACNIVLSDAQRTRCGFSAKTGGLGLRTIADRVDAAYIASRAATDRWCRRIRPEHKGAHDLRDGHLQHAIDSLRRRLPDVDVGNMDLEDITQSKLNVQIDAANIQLWCDEVQPQDRVHLQAYSAKGCGHEITLVPSKTLDTHLSLGEFVTTVSRRLGVDVMDSGLPCGFCGQLLDALGLHCLSCTAGGDATSQHNGVRDVYYDFCERGGLRPLSEAPDILKDLFSRDGRRRPADILCIPALALARPLPNGARAIRTEPVCFDFAVINALGQDHWQHTATSAGSAADHYGRAKASRNDISNKCIAAGYRFWPVVHEVQGGTSKVADAALRAICEAVGERESREPADVRQELLGRVAAVVARTAARAVQKRAARRQPRGECSSTAVSVRRVLAEAAEEQVAGDGRWDDEIATYEILHP